MGTDCLRGVSLASTAPMRAWPELTENLILSMAVVASAPVIGRFSLWYVPSQ